ncbi:hypothetical protein [Bacillus sp. FJAT-22090]|uniref:hypothetical protein n=1 Tax=Bacillus sp. FJAT-22090 TaxID=1581038 RepID=UPI0011A3349E|nr:hypothetical protein [Bacillus sp. FJAT-22090]
MKVDLNEFKAKKNEITTPKALVNNLLNHICTSQEVDVVVFITRSKDGEVEIGYSEGQQSEIVGLLEIGKTLTINDILDQ